MREILWKDEPDAKDYLAADNYLTLLFQSVQIGRLISELEKAKMSSFKARDIIRASGLPVLGLVNDQVTKNLKKVKNGEYLSPILLIAGQPLIIADGYHRVCAVIRIDEAMEIPCKIA